MAEDTAKDDLLATMATAPAIRKMMIFIGLILAIVTEACLYARNG